MMSLDWITIARPYAKAVFEVAIDSEKASQALKDWSDVLNKLAFIADQPEIVFFIKRPDVSPEEMVETFVDVAELSHKEKDDQKRFVELLAQTGRLGALPAIQNLYEKLRADYEKTIEANVVSFDPLTDAQQESLAMALKTRLKRDVHLTVQIDKSLLGGAIVCAGDIVVDGSVRGKLNRLNDEMMK